MLLKANEIFWKFVLSYVVLHNILLICQIIAYTRLFLFFRKYNFNLTEINWFTVTTYFDKYSLGFKFKTLKLKNLVMVKIMNVIQ